MNFSKLFVGILVFTLTFSTYADSTAGLNLKDLALPSEVKNLGKSTGSVFYSPFKKGKVLIPVNMWGEVKKPGLHFVPLGTNLIEGVSLAGGATSYANMEGIRLTRRADDMTPQDLYFDLSQGGDKDAFQAELRPRDTVFVERSTYQQDRAYYTSLVGVAATVLSAIFLYNRIEDT